MEQRNFSDSSNDFKISKFIRDLNQDILSKNDIKQRINLLLEEVYNGEYDNLCIVSFKGLSMEDTLNVLIGDDIDVIDIEEDEDIIIYGDPQDLFRIKESITRVLPNVIFDMDEITMLPKEKIELNGEDLSLFKKLLMMLDEIEDVANIYHNVSNV